MTIVTNNHKVKGSKLVFFSLRDQCETKNIFKGSEYELNLNFIVSCFYDYLA
jgi:hypothetical protein